VGVHRNNKGDNDDATVRMRGSPRVKVGGDRDEDTFTNGDWAKVRDTVRRELKPLAVYRARSMDWEHPVR
jgi:hypothetical protein